MNADIIIYGYVTDGAIICSSCFERVECVDGWPIHSSDLDEDMYCDICEELLD